MTTSWQRPRDEHGRFAKPAGELRANGHKIADVPRDASSDWWRDAARKSVNSLHHFNLGPETDTCRTCGNPWRHERHIRPVKVWLTDIDDPIPPRRLLAALPFVIALLGLGFSIAALIVGVQR